MDDKKSDETDRDVQETDENEQSSNDDADETVSEYEQYLEDSAGEPYEDGDDVLQAMALLKVLEEHDDKNL